MSDAGSHGDSDLPPSACYVADVLERDGPLTTREIVAKTGLVEPTTRRALRTLIDRGIVAKTRDPGDLRTVVYHYDR